MTRLELCDDPFTGLLKEVEGQTWAAVLLSSMTSSKNRLTGEVG